MPTLDNTFKPLYGYEERNLYTGKNIELGIT